jgi:hypothetical protein
MNTADQIGQVRGYPPMMKAKLMLRVGGGVFVL